MTHKTLLLFATELEARETRKITQHDILITGMGPQAVYTSLSPIITAYDTIINVGVVGTMHEHISIGSLVPIREVHDLQEQKSITIASSGYSLVTVHAPLYEKLPEYDLVDMEAYAIVDLCQQYKKTLVFIKIVSDVVSHASSRHIKERIGSLSHILARHIVEKCA